MVCENGGLCVRGVLVKHHVSDTMNVLIARVEEESRNAIDCSSSGSRSLAEGRSIFSSNRRETGILSSSSLQ